MSASREDQTMTQDLRNSSATSLPHRSGIFARALNRVPLVARASAMLALVLGLISVSGSAYAAKPEIDPVYAQGNTYYMIAPHVITNPNPHLFNQSEELYIVAYPWDGTTAPVLASGYVPQCNPCYHPGLPAPFV